MWHLFEKVSEAHLMQAKKWIDACDHVIAALDLSTAGETAMCLKTLCDYAKSTGKKYKFIRIASRQRYSYIDFFSKNTLY